MQFGHHDVMLSGGPEVLQVEANDASFHCLAAGSGPLVLLLHGFPDDATTWLDLIPKLADAGFRAVAPYLRGYAPTSSSVEVEPAPSVLGADVIALIGALAQDGRASVVGMDWGGVAAHAAMAMSPDRIAAAVVMNTAHPLTLPAVVRDPDQVRRLFHFWFFTTPMAPLAVGTPGLPMIDQLWRLWSPALVDGEQLTRVKATLSQPGVLPYALRYYPALLHSVLAGRFPSDPIVTPTLSIFGGEDVTCVHSDRERPAFIGAYERSVLEGVGHFPHLERPDQVAGLIVDWLRRYGDRRAEQDAVGSAQVSSDRHSGGIG